ncbi:MAG: hypothetical protein LUG26_00225 [Ruminococcus sp.]|nr:hypothetical protein [Ruminococcus sp.]
MINGVNKRIIEINNPDSIYFEKAIFYLKPNVRELPTAVSEAEIRKYIDNLGIDDFSSCRPHKFKKIFLFLLAAATAAGIAIPFLT